MKTVKIPVKLILTVLRVSTGETVEVVSASDPSKRYTYNLLVAAGQAWRFHDWVLSNSVYLDDYREFNGGAGRQR